MENYNFNKDANHFASIFGDGSTNLTELIKYCILNGIKTDSCSKGYLEKNKNGYITFKFGNELKDRHLAYYLSTIPFKIEGLTAIVSSKKDIDGNMLARFITLELPYTNSRLNEEYFYHILLELKKYENDKVHIIDSFIREIVDYIFYNYDNEPQEMFSITNKFYKKELESGDEIAMFPVTSKNKYDFNVFVNKHYNSTEKIK